MAIEFRCTQCGKLLRTADTTAGKQAKCPSCGTVVTIPQAGTTESIGSPPPPPQGPGNAAGPAMGDNPYASPAQPAVGSAAAMNVGGDIVPTRIDIGDVFNRTWTILKDQMGLCIGAAIVAALINGGAQFAVQMAISILANVVRDDVLVFLLTIVGIIVNTLVNLWIAAGQTHLFLRIARGEQPAFSELFSGGRWFLPVVGAYVLFFLSVMVGLTLCVVPGVIVGLMFSQFLMLIVDRDLGIMDSLKTSMTIMTGNKLTLFLIFLAVIGLTVAAAIPCCLGFIILLPFVALLYPVTYLTMTGQPTAVARAAA